MESEPISLINFLRSLNEALAESLISLDSLKDEIKYSQNNCYGPNCKVEKLLIFTFLESECKIYPQN